MQPIESKLIKKAISYVSPETDEAGIKQQEDADKLLTIFQKAKDQIATKIVKYKKAQNSSEYLTAIKTLHEELDELTEKEGLILYTKRAVRDINSAYKKSTKDRRTKRKELRPNIRFCKCIRYIR